MQLYYKGCKGQAREQKMRVEIHREGGSFVMDFKACGFVPFTR
jgi:hypothetical protein